MTSLRNFFSGIIVSLILAGPALGANQIRVYVPANAYHAEQELVVGQPGEIYVEVTNDVELVTVTMSLEVANLAGTTRLWSPITGAEMEFLLVADELDARSFKESGQTGDWPDSLHAWAITISSPTRLAAGTHQFLKMTVTPTATGTVVLTDALVSLHWCEFHDGTTLFRPEVLLPNITIIELDDCNSNGIPDVQEVAEGTALDCNANLIPDACDPDLNFNGIPDDCEIIVDCNGNGFDDIDDIAAGQSNDINHNLVPDECEGLAGNYVQIYKLPGQLNSRDELLQGQSEQIMIAIVNDQPVQFCVMPVRFSSADGSPLWATLTESDVTFLIPESPSANRSASIKSGEGDWPDTLVVVQGFYGDAALSPGFHPFAAITVTASELGTITWEEAPIPPASESAAFFVDDGSGGIAILWIDLQAEEMTIIPNLDCNHNGVVDADEVAGGSAPDCNSNGLPDECDIANGTAEDCNENGVPDVCDPDLNLNGVPDDCEPNEDCNQNGFIDTDDIAAGRSNDINHNSVPDECEGLDGNYFRLYVLPGEFNSETELVQAVPRRIMIGVVNDQPIEAASLPFSFNSGDGTPLWAPLVEDDVTFLTPDHPGSYKTVGLNRQGGNWPDTIVAVQILLGEGVLPPGFHPIMELTVLPTELGSVIWAEAPHPPDMTGASFLIVDADEMYVDLQAEQMTVIPNSDCNDNGLIDAEEIALGSAPDCNENGLPDECDIAGGTSEDCNQNGVPDECDLDLNWNDIPDDCEVLTDCNQNGVPDEDDILGGASTDSDQNGVPDECEGLAGNFVRIYVPQEDGREANTLIRDQPGHIVIGIANDVPIAAVAVPFQYSSSGGGAIWATPTEEDTEFLMPNNFTIPETEIFSYMDGTWPDTLVVVQSMFNREVLPVGFHAFYVMTVMPTELGTVSFEVAPVPGGYAPAQFVTEDFSDLYVPIEAADIAILATCCVGRVGNVNQIGGDEPTIGDVAFLIDHLFITGTIPNCLAESDINQSGGADPGLNDITIGDIARLIEYLFLTGGSMPACL